MNIAFFELEGWERPLLEQTLGKDGHQLQFFTHTASPEDARTLAECEILSPFIASRVNAQIIGLAPKLKLISTRSTGFDHIDRGAAGQRGIAVANVPEYGSNTVAEHTFALLLALSRRVIPAYIRTKAGRFSTDGLRGFDLRGKTCGVLGTGNIGLHFIRMALSFGMKVVASDPYPRNSVADVLGFEYVPFDTLLEISDVISLHCPATAENKHVIRAGTIAKMKRGVVLLNTARGSLINTHDLLAALQAGQVGGAGLDVFEGELAVKEDLQLQLSLDRQDLISVIETHSLLSRENVIVTPHNAFNSAEAVRRILDTTIANIRAFAAQGKPEFAVKT